MPTRNLTGLQPSNTYQYLIQTDTETTTAGLLTASLQTGLGVPIAQLDIAVATASYALNANIDTGSILTTASFNAFTASYRIDSASWSASVADLYTGSTAFYQLSASYALDSASFSASIAQRVRSVNGIFPDTTGNVAVSVAATGTGTLANRPLSASNAFLYVVSQDPNPADNGDAYIFVTSSLVPGSGSWEVIAPLDQAASDARYLMLAGTNSPMQGDVDWGGYLVTNLAQPVTGSDVANKTYVDTLVATQTLQAVTTKGNQTSASVFITGSLTNGFNVQTIGQYSHAEGQLTTTIGNGSHAEGYQTTALTNGQYAHVEGWGTVANAFAQHIQGQWNASSSVQSAFIIGNGTSNAARSNLMYAAGTSVQISGSLNVSSSIISPRITGSLFGTASWAVSSSRATTASYALTATTATTASYALTSSVATTATTASYVATASYVPTLQQVTTAGNITSNNVIIQASLDNGDSNTTLGPYSHTEGYFTTTIGDYSHAEGLETIASGQYSHAEGFLAEAIGQFSHAEGRNTTAIGQFSHAEGWQTTALGNRSHAEGWGTVANYLQHAEGMWNDYTDTTQGAFIVGNGLSDATRSNLIFAAGNTVTINGTLSATTLTGNFAGSITNAVTASYVSGAILNIPDPYTSTAPVFRIVTLTQAEYTAIAVKDSNTFYAIV